MHRYEEISVMFDTSSQLPTEGFSKTVCVILRFNIISLNAYFKKIYAFRTVLLLWFVLGQSDQSRTTSEEKKRRSSQD
jgi:hypothetical protein